MTRKEVDERLTVIRGQLDAIGADVHDLVNANATTRLGARMTYINDRLELAVEEIDKCLAFPDEPVTV